LREKKINWYDFFDKLFLAFVVLIDASHLKVHAKFQIIIYDGSAIGTTYFLIVRRPELDVNLVLKFRFPISTMSGMSRGEVKSPYDVSPVSSAFNCLLNRGTVKVKECKDPLYLNHRNNFVLQSNCVLNERKL
jgi:hypothetical protein